MRNSPPQDQSKLYASLGLVDREWNCTLSRACPSLYTDIKQQDHLKHVAAFFAKYSSQLINLHQLTISSATRPYIHDQRLFQFPGLHSLHLSHVSDGHMPADSYREVSSFTMPEHKENFGWRPSHYPLQQLTELQLDVGCLFGLEDPAAALSGFTMLRRLTLYGNYEVVDSILANIATAIPSLTSLKAAVGPTTSSQVLHSFSWLQRVELQGLLQTQVVRQLVGVPIAAVGVSITMAYEFSNLEQFLVEGGGGQLEELYVEARPGLHPSRELLQQLAKLPSLRSFMLDSGTLPWEDLANLTNVTNLWLWQPPESIQLTELPPGIASLCLGAGACAVGIRDFRSSYRPSLTTLQLSIAQLDRNGTLAAVARCFPQLRDLALTPHEPFAAEALTAIGSLTCLTALRAKCSVLSWEHRNAVAVVGRLAQLRVLELVNRSCLFNMHIHAAVKLSNCLQRLTRLRMRVGITSAPGQIEIVHVHDSIQVRAVLQVLQMDYAALATDKRQPDMYLDCCSSVFLTKKLAATSMDAVQRFG